MTAASAPRSAGARYATATADPLRPVLLTGLSAVALMNGAGELSYVRETRGAPIDWGGAYAQSVRLTGPWSTRLLRGGRSFDLGRATLVHLEQTHGGVSILHEVDGRLVRDEWRIPLDGEAICRTLEIDPPSGGDARTGVEVEFEPFLAPVAFEGIKPTSYRAGKDGEHWHVRSFGFALRWESLPGPVESSSAGRPWRGEPLEGPVAPLRFRWDLSGDPARAASLHFRISGGLLGPTLARARPPSSTEPRRREIDAAYDAWTERAPRLSFPDAPRLERGYELARSALRSLYTAPDPSITGLVAGYPWYSAVWGRDLAWMLPAVAWLGDWAWVERSLATIFRFQAHAALPVLGARPGELPMQVAPGPVFLFGTSDTTLYYPALLRRLAEQTGSYDVARRHWSGLVEALGWGLSKSTGPLGLLSHGDEIAAMRQETAVGRVRVGIDAVDTTIWDATDRRAHAVDVQVLWLEALEAMAAMAAGGVGAAPGGLAERAEGVRRAIAERYRWPEERYLVDTLAPDGTPARRLRPNALRAVRTGALGADVARALVRRAAEPDLTTPWGVRTLSDRDPAYDPQAYHDGQVWTIATAWAAEASLLAGEADLGVAYLDTIAGRLLEEGGYAAECYRGDRPTPFDACFLLGFSVAPFLSALFDALWGITPSMVRRSVDVRPRFPSSWRSAGLDRLRLGDGTLALDWTPTELGASWSGPGPITLTGAPGTVRLDPGAPARFAMAIR